MHVKHIKWTDYNEVEREGDFYFNLTKAEAIELNIRNDIATLTQRRDPNEIMDALTNILRKAYGIRMPNGDFVKDPKEFDIFAASEAYSELFMELFQEAGYAAEFIKAILPKDMPEGVETPQSQSSSIPESLRNHPSMQGRRSALRDQPVPPQARETAVESPAQMEERITREVRERIAAEQASQKTHNDPALQASRQAEEQSWGQTSPERVSTAPENPQESIAPARDELI